MQAITCKYRELRSLLLGALALTSVVACSQTPEVVNSDTEPRVSKALGNVELHTHQLANELFSGFKGNRNSRYAVVGFVPVDSLKYDESSQHPLMYLGHQLEQGMITEASRRGLIAQEYKLSSDILINDNSDRVLTRDIERLTASNSVDFYITGTLVYQQEGAIVNARIINAQSKDIVAAATRFFPSELFWQREQVTTRNGMLYRTEASL
ncbi:FlgO family outer membrane protein [Alteromonas facilis]|uniref:FlgO family outer membrane protein n=1 Tax=Alteromonas facilis TaxID=2048004 RepID=UPI000C286D0D|nr:FlgO family outer membrane protein [Alteromonas facilis]